MKLELSNVSICQVLALDDKPLLKGVWSGSRDPYFKFWSCNHISGMGEARHFNFRVTIDNEEYYCYVHGHHLTIMVKLFVA